MQIQTYPDGFDLLLDGRLLLRHRSDAPCLFIGQGDARMDMYRGNFDIEDYVIERTPLSHAEVSGTGNEFEVVVALRVGAQCRIVDFWCERQWRTAAPASDGRGPWSVTESGRPGGGDIGSAGLIPCRSSIGPACTVMSPQKSIPQHYLTLKRNRTRET
jgi:hypothetical protein